MPRFEIKIHPIIKSTMADIEMGTKEKRVPDIDADFDPGLDDIDDEQTLDEEEAFSSDYSNELNDLQNDGEIPLEELMAAYNHRADEDALTASLATSAPPLHNPLDLNVSISSEDDILSNEDLTLDKDQIGRDLLLSTDRDSERPTSADDLMHSVHMSPGHLDKSKLQPLLSRHSLATNCAISQRDNLDMGSLSDIGESDESSENSDPDYVPTNTEIPLVIHVGEQHQAVLPDLADVYEAPDIEQDTLMWDPNQVDDEQMVVKYLDEVEQMKDLTSPSASFLVSESHITKDDESALAILLEHREKEKSLDELACQINKRDCNQGINWELAECIRFEQAFFNYGKNFFQIHHEMLNRSVGELIEFYYYWKKTERYDNFLIMRKEKDQMIKDQNAEFLERFQNACHDSSSDLEAFNELDKFSNQDFYNMTEEGGSVASSDMEINIDEPSDSPEVDLSNSTSESESLKQSLTPEPTLMPLNQPLSPKQDLNAEIENLIKVSHEDKDLNCEKPITECLDSNLVQPKIEDDTTTTSTQSLTENENKESLVHPKLENISRVASDTKDENTPCSVESTKRAFDISNDYCINDSPSKKSRQANGQVEFRLQSFNNSNLLKSQSAVSTTD